MVVLSAEKVGDFCKFVMGLKIRNMGKYYEDGSSYMPSNGSEGSWFEDKYCMRCVHTNPDPRGKKQCEIWCMAIMSDFGSAEYPKEWQYMDDVPVCTAHKEWDWEVMGDPDDQDNPNYQQPKDPNQIELF